MRRPASKRGTLRSPSTTSSIGSTEASREECYRDDDERGERESDSTDQPGSRPPPRLTVGIDLGDRHSHLCVLDSDGAILEQSRLQTTPAAFRQRFAAMPPARIAIEAGTHSPWVNALLTELGHEVLVANPRKLRAI